MPKVRSGERLKEYRESYNYRAEYFKRNPGIFHHIWFCSQCGRPLIGKKNVYIDHIIPLSKGGRNHVSNCTAICFKCNRNKSDKVDYRVAKGYIFKFFESATSRATRGVGGAAMLGVGLTAGAASGALRAGRWGITRGLGAVGRIVGTTVRGVFGAVTFPLRKGNVASRLFFVALYALAILFLLKNYTHILDAWFN